MRLATLDIGGELRSALVVGEAAVEVGPLTARLGIDPLPGEARTSWNRRLVGDPELAARLTAAATDLASAGDELAMQLTGLRFGPPLPDPEKIICLGLNYADHVAEAKMELPPVPPFFAKFVNSLAGPEDPIELPTNSDSIDYEGELAVVIGKTAKDVDDSDALSYVAGYTVFDDVSARDLQMSGAQWLPGKIQDGFAPMGPILVGSDEIADPSALRIRTWLNGELVQDAPTSSMITSVPAAVAYLSTLVTLVPGDIIATGTPSGVLFGQDDPTYLGPGDVVEVEIEEIGRLRNELRAADS